MRRQLLLLGLVPLASCGGCGTWYDVTTYGDSWVSAAAFGANRNGHPKTPWLRSFTDPFAGPIGPTRTPDAPEVVADSQVASVNPEDLQRS